MEADENSTQVRRTARARKVNPKFFGNDTGYESYMQLVGRITASNFSQNKDADNTKEFGSDEKLPGDPCSESEKYGSELNNQPAISLVPIKPVSNSSDSNINITLKTVSFKKIKKVNDLQISSPRPFSSIIVRSRSSTESEMSEDSVATETERKRKCVSLKEEDVKKLRTLSSDLVFDNSPSNVEGNSLSSPNSNIKIASRNSSQLLQRAFVPLSFSNNLGRNQPKIVLTSQSKINFGLPGKKLKIVSLKPIALKKDIIPISFDPNLHTSSENFARNLVLGEGGPVELKIVKKEVYPISSSSLPPIITPKDAKEKSPKCVPEKLQDENKEPTSGNWFSSDGEDDIPLNKLLVKEGAVKKKKKIVPKDKSQKPKLKKNKVIKNEMGKRKNDQDDLPLKVLIKKSKSLSKGLSDKVKNTIRKKKIGDLVGEKVIKESDSEENSVKSTVVKKKKVISNVNEKMMMKENTSEEDSVKSGVVKKKKKISSETLAENVMMKENGSEEDSVKSSAGKKKKKISSETLAEKVMMKGIGSEEDSVKSSAIKKKKKKISFETLAEKLVMKASGSEEDSVKSGIIKKKKKKISPERSSSKEQPIKLKISKMKSETDIQSQKVKPFILKKKKPKMETELHESKLLKKLNEKKLKRLGKFKASKSDLKFASFKNKEEFRNKKMKEGKTFQKLRFKFPKKIKKIVSNDTPLASETTNVVISVSGIEGDYACVAIPKPEEPESEKPTPKPKKKKVSSESSSFKKYTFDSGLVLEDVPVEAEPVDFSTKIEMPVVKTQKERLCTDSVKSEDGIKNDVPDGYELNEEEPMGQKNSQEDIVPSEKKEHQYVWGIVTTKSQQQKTSKTFLKEVAKDSKENEGSNKRRSIDKKETLSENEVKKSKEKEKKRDEKVKLNTSTEKIDADLDRVKKSDLEHKFKQSRKENLSAVSYNAEGIKIEEKSFKKEKNESSKKIGKEISERTEKLEKENKDSLSKKIEKEKVTHSSRKLEREDSKSSLTSTKKPHKEDSKSETMSSKKTSKEDKLDMNFSSKKTNKMNDTTNIILEKETVKIEKEKEATKDDAREAATPGNKVKKKENFEEALLSIPLPKLSKHRRDKDDRHKRDKEEKYRKYEKEKKYDVKQEIHLIKHKEYDNERELSKAKEASKSSCKVDKSRIKLESHSKEIKKEDKGHHKEERRHSSSGSSKSDKRKHDHDSKDNIKLHVDSSTDEKDRKRKRDEKERSRHSSSHKKHKKEHSEPRRSHSSSSSSSSEKKKHKAEEVNKHDFKYNKDKTLVKSEDRKDIFINKIIDGEENHDIKRERVHSRSISEDTGSRSLISESEAFQAIRPKNEMKAEVLIDEEHLVNVGQDSMKEEYEEATIASADFVKPKTIPEFRHKDEVSTLISEDENEIISLKREILPAVESIQEKIERTDEENEGAKAHVNVERFTDDNMVRDDVIEMKRKEENPLSISEIDLKSYDSSKENAESDLGILDELRTLKQMSIEERLKSEVIFDKNEIEERINTSGSQVNDQCSVKTDVGDAEVDKKSDMEEIFGESDRSPVNFVTKSEQEEASEVNEKMESETFDKPIEHPNDSEIPVPTAAGHEIQSREEVKDVLVSDLDNTSEQLTDKNQFDQINQLDILKKEDKQDIISNDQLNVDEKDQFISRSQGIKDEKSEESCMPLSLIPLPREKLSAEAPDMITDPQLPPSSLSESTPISPSEPDEGFSEVPSHTREHISSEEENVSPDASEDEILATVTEQPPIIVPKELSPEEKEEIDKRNKQIVENRMKGFEHLDENLYLVERVRNKRSKEAKRMVCDCTLTKEEISNGEMGCADDCLNRLLMIECGSRCPLKDRCMNKKFQQMDYRKVEVFNAEEKGCGVRSCDEIKQGTFILEYIGEVFDTKEFKRRRKDYAKSGSPHFYFMALRSDRLIDATRKGNISRFVNHSCSPNAETQKWTVNGDIRVGFFATRNIPVNEEITFDYRLERYGREPQKCYCGTPECRGWLGEPPDKKTKEEKEEDRKREIRDKQRKEAKRFLFEDMDLEDEIEKLTVRGLRNRQDTLNLSRLMVRCEDSESRLVLLKILESGEEASKRLFLDYHGLKLLWSWMVDISSSHKCILLKLEILKTLSSLPITNKSQITDSKVINIVERWSNSENKVENKEIKESDVKDAAIQDKKLSDGSDSDTETSETKDSDPSPSDTISPDDSSQDSSEIVDPVAPINKETESSTSVVPISNELNSTEQSSDTTEVSVAELASNVLSVWSDLKEAFKIPKKERIEMMKEHEREVDQEYEKSMDRNGDDSFDDRNRSYYDSWRCTSDDKDKQRDQRDRERRRDRRWSKWKDYYEEDERGLSKEERRERFAKQVAKEDEEARQRKLQEEMWKLHLERCRLLGHDPYFTPIFDPSGQFYWDPGAGTWQAYIGPSGNLPVPASYGMHRPEGNENICPNIPTNQLFVSGAFYPLPHTPVSDGEGLPFGGTLTKEENSLSLDLSSIPLPGEAPLSTKISPTDSPVISSTLIGEDDNMDIDNGIETPPMAPPGPVTIKLPQKWKIARDIERRIYFYHTKTRYTQWDLPTDDLHTQLMTRYGLTSDSESDLESDSDSSSSSDSEDFSSDEDENDEEEVEEDPVKQIENEFDEKMIRRPKGKKVRSERLVQERVISPIMFRDREAARRERKEAKERAREEARKERWTLLKALKGGAGGGGGGGSNSSTPKPEIENESTSLSEDTVLSPNENEDDEHLEEQLLKFSRKQKSEGKHKAKKAAISERKAHLVIECISKNKNGKGTRRVRSRFKERNGRRIQVQSKERAATALADTSDLARKIKDNFRSRMATYIVSVLNPYRKADCKEGRITSNEDFKYLARKLTHFVMVKELKQLPSIDGLDCSDSVKHKTKEFVRKYMSKYGNTFKRDPNDTKEY